MIDQTISHYRVLEKLGSGGMGVVYRAEDLTLRRQVALKFLLGKLAREPAARSRLLREARTAAAINHPNICTIYEVGEVGEDEQPLRLADEEIPSGTPFIAMELVAGRTLQEVLTTAGPLPLAELLDITVQVARGLAEAHTHKIIHRDLKPQNVMVDSEGRVKILDFGLAKPLEPPRPGDEVLSAAETFSAELTREGKVVGTVAYMSPEQAVGKPLDSRSDIFSFGTMLYEMITGRRPFQGETATSTLAKILEAEPAPISDLTPEPPADLGRIVRRCLQKNPAERYNDTRDLVVDLRELHQAVSSGAVRKAKEPTAGEGISLPLPSSVPVRTRNTQLAFGIVAALALLATVLIALSIVNQRDSSPLAANHEQVTFTGDASFPAISPDGRTIAYVTGKAGDERRVMVQDIGGGQALQVFRGQSSEFLRWSPDGSELLFTARFEDKLGTALVRRLGGDPRWFQAFVFLSWSPDGSRFAGTRFAARKIYLVDKSTGEETSVALSGSFTWETGLDWSATAPWLVLNSVDDQERYALWTLREDGSQEQKVIEDTAPLFSPRWSPRGDAIYYLRARQQTKELWKIPIDPRTGESNGPSSLLLQGLQAGDYFTLSRDGKRLAYTRELSRSNLWLVSLRGSGREPTVETKQLTTGTLMNEDPSVSPDGSRIAFSRGDGQTANIFIMALDGGSVQPITFLTSFNRGPVWSPDGNEIAFGSSEGRSPKIWRVRSTGGPARKFERSHPSSNTYSLAWAPGPKILYQRPGNRNFHKLDPATEEEKPLVEDESVGWMFFPRYSPDSKKVVLFWNRRPSRGLWLISLEESSQLPLHEGDAHALGWSSDGKHVYALDETEKKILMIPASGGEPRTVVTLPFHESVGAVSMTQDGRQFVCAVSETQSDVWTVENFDPDVR